MMRAKRAELSLGELSAETGLPGRTIRFYIARGLIPGPLRAGRGARYSAEHLSRLETIRQLQEKGLTLLEIGHQLSGGSVSPALAADRVAASVPSPGPAVEPVAWWQYRLAEDVVVHVRGDAPPWRLKRIRNQLAQMAGVLCAGENEDKV